MSNTIKKSDLINWLDSISQQETNSQGDTSVLVALRIDKLKEHIEGMECEEGECYKCKYEDKLFEEFPCNVCEHNFVSHYIRKDNQDMFAGVDTTDLGVYLAQHWFCPFKYDDKTMCPKYVSNTTGKPICVNCVTDWLMEANDED